AYTMRSPSGGLLPRQPRINKPGLGWVLREGFAVEQAVFFCDVDNTDHAPWSLPLLEAALRQYEELEILQTAGVYHTQHGRRIVQPLAVPILPQRSSPTFTGGSFSSSPPALGLRSTQRRLSRSTRMPSPNRSSPTSERKASR